jgi:elongation factor P
MKATTIRKGVVIMFNGTPHRVLEFFHNTPGKGRASVSVKLRNLLNGNQTENKYAANDEVEEADVHSSSATYMYNDGASFFFMNSSTYEEIPIPTEVVGDGAYYLQEGMAVDITTFQDAPIGIKLPTSVILTIVQTEPELKGATASNSPKPAITDTGLQLSVPPFVKEGERIVVGTDDGTYMKRAD